MIKIGLKVKENDELKLKIIPDNIVALKTDYKYYANNSTIVDDFKDHISNNIIHVTQEDRDRWDNGNVTLYDDFGYNTDGSMDQATETDKITDRPYVVIGTDFPEDSGFNETVILFDTDDKTSDTGATVDSAIVGQAIVGGGSGGDVIPGFNITYNTLTNKPSINNVILVGNKSFEDLGLYPLTQFQMEKVIQELEGGGGN